MSTHVASIVSGMKTLVAASLSTWEELPFVQDISKNNKRTAANAYGVRALAASESEGALLRTVTLDHTFEIILTENYVNRQSDAEIEASLNNLYDKADEIFKVLVNSKVNLPELVLSVSSPSILDPEILETAKFVALRLQLKVKYRSTL